MKNLSLLFIAFLFLQFTSPAQQIITEQTNEPIFFKLSSHDTNIKNLPQKSFYESKADWQYIIDTTWGSGLPLAQKRQIFNSFVSGLEQEFDGFESLGLTPTTWDTLKNYFYSKIDSSTSRGRFSAIMDYFSIALRDWHTYAFDWDVFSAPLNPGVPLLHITAAGDWRHAGAVVTVLPDSTIIVLRVAPNHPLNLQPGDIILGYNGVKWIELLNELMEAELPVFPASGGSQTAHNDAMFVGSIMNWHLFDTIDILKYSTGDTLHLDLTPMVGFNTSAMTNNEQMPVPGVPFPPAPFPDFNTAPISYGIIQNTNIGYIYIFHHMVTQMNQKMLEAVDSLKYTDGLIIDMRFTYGGWTSQVWQEALRILANEDIYTITDAFRCSPANWNLCLTGDSSQMRIPGVPPQKYERPIALLTGPFCISMGDRNAYRLSHLENVRTFGKPTYGSLGLSNEITNFNGWYINYSIQDFALVSDHSHFLNRKELPIDFPVWHNRDDVAMGKDAVVEKALDWINNLVYAHDLNTNKEYYIPGTDSIVLNAQVENPNTHQVSVVTYIKNWEGLLIDSVFLNPSGDPQSETWTGVWDTPIQEDIFKLDITAKDLVTSESFTLKNVNRFTTAGPVVLDSLKVTYNSFPKTYSVKPIVKNNGQSFAIENLTIKLFTTDSSVTISAGAINVASISPGEIITPYGSFTARVDSNFSGTFNFKFDFMVDGWKYWTDSTQIIVGVEDELNELPTEYLLSQNYPNPLNPTTTIKYSIPKSSQVSLKIFNTLGQEIETLVNEEKPVGTYELNWNAANLPSGVYFYRLQAGDYVETRKMILLK